MLGQIPRIVKDDGKTEARRVPSTHAPPGPDAGWGWKRVAAELPVTLHDFFSPDTVLTVAAFLWGCLDLFLEGAVDVDQYLLLFVR